MIEIDEIIPYYLCNRYKPNPCEEFGYCEDVDCKHTNNEIYAKHADAVEIFNLFADTFKCVVDDYGRLVIYEKERTDEHAT